MIGQPICRCHRFSHDIRVVSIREYASLAQFERQEYRGPGSGLPTSSPGTVAIASQSMDEADVDRGVGAVMKNFNPIWKGGWVRRGILAARCLLLGMSLQ